MREVFGTTAQWLKAGVPCALGTLVETYGSAPAPIGTTVAVDGGGRIAGNIGAGCYESDVIEACLRTIGDGMFRVLRLNLSSDDELTGSNGCGGGLKVAVWQPSTSFADTALAIVNGLEDVGVQLPQDFAFTVPGKRRIVVVGATALAGEIAHIAKRLDFFVTVVDPRPAFATVERLRDADEIVLQWPDACLPGMLRTAAAMLVVSHDPKFDLSALRVALHTSVPYIGLLGSRRSQALRRESLQGMGFSQGDLSRIHGPAGLDVGGQTEAETALSMLAHVIAEANGRSGMPLEGTSGSIHSVNASAVSMST